jgi:two-component sensor histidine kinase
MRSTVVEQSPHISLGVELWEYTGEPLRPDASLNLLVRELQHRIRNLLTVVQCLVIQTDSSTADGYRDALTARLSALSDAYGLIESASDHRVALADLLKRTLKPYSEVRRGRIRAAGPDVVLEPPLALSLHMALHELATNAIKHGALASRYGVVEVLWDILLNGDDRTLAVQWREHGGPKVRKPRHQGFGLRLISKVVPGARVEVDFAPAGLLCRLLVDIDPSQKLEESDS